MRWALVVLVAVAALLVPAGANAAFGPVAKDLRLSHMGPDGDSVYGVYFPEIAYNARSNEYLAVWRANDGTPPLAENEYEIYAQRLSAAGKPLGARIRVSVQGADGVASSVGQPDVAYNAVANEYLVVWDGVVGTSYKFEIWGRRLSAKGERLGGNDDVQISATGSDASASYYARAPSVAADRKTGGYLVVWFADDVGVADEFEIIGQRLTVAGAETGADDFRISEQGANGNPASGAFVPSVAYNSVTDQYLVAWTGSMGTSVISEIWAQRLSAQGAEVGGNDFQVSGHPVIPSPGSALWPDVVANPVTGEFLVVWADDGDSSNREQLDVRGQRLTKAGAQTGADDFRISDMGTTGLSYCFCDTRGAGAPDAAADPRTGEFVVVWAGDDVSEPVVGDYELESYGQRLTAKGAATGADDFRISHMGPDGYYELGSAEHASVAAGAKGSQYFSVWAGYDGEPEAEIYGRRLSGYFGAKAQVRVSLAANRVGARGPLKVVIANANGFEVTGKLSGRSRGGIALKSRALRVAAHRKAIVRLTLPQAARLLLARDAKLSLHITVRAKDPLGHTRIATKNLKVLRR